MTLPEATAGAALGEATGDAAAAGDAAGAAEAAAAGDAAGEAAVAGLDSAAAAVGASAVVGGAGGAGGVLHAARRPVAAPPASKVRSRRRFRSGGCGVEYSITLTFTGQQYAALGDARA